MREWGAWVRCRVFIWSTQLQVLNPVCCNITFAAVLLYSQRALTHVVWLYCIFTVFLRSIFCKAKAMPKTELHQV